MNDRESKFPKPGPVAAIVVMAFELVMAFYGFSLAQYYLGMWGLVITEIGCLLIGLIAALVVGLDIKQMLPLKRIRVNEFFGTLMMWGGSLLCTLIINLALFSVFPGGITKNAELNDFTSTWPAGAALFVASVMPAICEETLHRGFIQRCIMTKVKSKFLVSFIMALFFGLFHMDFYRFLGTAFLGGVMAYILCTTDNFFYNMLFHFVNNLFAEVISLYSANSLANDATNQVADKLSGVLPVAFGVYCVIGCVAPLLMLGGSMLLKGKRRLLEEGKKKLIISIVAAIVIAAALFVTGCLIMFYFIYTGQMSGIMEGLN